MQDNSCQIGGNYLFKQIITVPCCCLKHRYGSWQSKCRVCALHIPTLPVRSDWIHLHSRTFRGSYPDEGMRSWNQDKMQGVKYIWQRGSAFLYLLNLTVRLTNAKFSGSRRPGHRRPATCSLISQQSDSVSCNSTELHHDDINIISFITLLSPQIAEW